MGGLGAVLTVEEAVAELRIRRLAASLGLDKDTIWRAVERLVAAGLVSRHSTSPAGTCFDLIPPAGLISLVACAHGDTADCPHDGDTGFCYPDDGDIAACP